MFEQLPTDAQTQGPYPNHLQYREAGLGRCSAVERREQGGPQQQPSPPISAPTATEVDRAAMEALEKKQATVVQMAARDAARTQRAIDVITSSGIPLAEIGTAGDNNNSVLTRDIFQAACDGDVALLAAHLQPRSHASAHKDGGEEESDNEAGVGRKAAAAAVDINAIGQPHPANYKGVQFEKRWTFAAPPLVFAAAFNRERAVAALVAWGADVHATSTTGLTAKQYAQQRGYAAIVRLLEAAE